MKREIRISRRARRGFADIRDYIGRHDQAAAERLHQRIGRTIDLLAEFPYIGRPTIKCRDMGTRSTTQRQTAAWMSCTFVIPRARIRISTIFSKPSRTAAALARTFATALLVVLPISMARAETIRVLAAGAVQAAVESLQAPLAAASGHQLDAAFDTAGATRQRVLAGERVDVVILSAETLGAVAAAGRTTANAAVDLGSVQVAVAVRAGARPPDISSPDALKRALLAARSIAHSDPARGATAGTHFVGVLERLGIAGDLKARISVLPFGGEVVEGVAQGRFEIGVSQSSEISANIGVTLVGPLPEPLAHRTRYLAAATTEAGPAARAFLQLLASPQGRAAFAAAGFAAP